MSWLGFAASVAACAVCFSLRAMFRVCQDLLSVFGFGFSFLCDSRLFGVVVVVAMCPLFQFYVSGTRMCANACQCNSSLTPQALLELGRVRRKCLGDKGGVSCKGEAEPGARQCLP